MGKITETSPFFMVHFPATFDETGGNSRRVIPLSDASPMSPMSPISASPTPGAPGTLGPWDLGQAAPGHTGIGGDLVGIRWVAEAAGVDRRLGRHGLKWR